MLDNQEIINAINNREYTYAIVRDNAIIFNFTGSGIGAVAKTIKVDSSMLKGSEIYDTYVGKGVASLLAKYGAVGVYAEAITQKAIDVLDKYGVKYAYKELVPMIYNHDESAECPFEVGVKNTDDLDEVEDIVFKTIIELKKQENK